MLKVTGICHGRFESHYHEVSVNFSVLLFWGWVGVA